MGELVTDPEFLAPRRCLLAPIPEIRGRSPSGRGGAAALSWKQLRCILGDCEGRLVANPHVDGGHLGEAPAGGFEMARHRRRAGSCSASGAVATPHATAPNEANAGSTGRSLLPVLRYSPYTPRSSPRSTGRLSHCPALGKAEQRTARCLLVHVASVRSRDSPQTGRHNFPRQPSRNVCALQLWPHEQHSGGGRLDRPTGACTSPG